MGRKKKNIIIIICVLSIVIVYFLINFLIWGIVPPKKKIYFLNNEVSLKYERKNVIMELYLLCIKILRGMIIYLTETGN